MAEYVVSMLRALRAYLWASLVERLGPTWWGLALVAGLVAYALCPARARRTRSGRGRALAAGLLAAHVVLVVAATVLTRDVGGAHWQGFVDAGGFVGSLRGWRLGPDALANAAMLVPAGLLLPAATGWRLSRTALSCAAFSAWVEAVQYVCAVGWPDPLDVVLNTLGAVFGYGLWALATAARRRARGVGA